MEKISVSFFMDHSVDVCRIDCTTHKKQDIIHVNSFLVIYEVVDKSAFSTSSDDMSSALEHF